MAALLGVTAAGLGLDACSAANNEARMTGSSSSSSTGGAQPASSHSATTTGLGGEIVIGHPDGSSDANEEVVTNPCGTQCGPKELCDPAHVGFDDNCNGMVDEGCPCTPGEVHWCFKGDPSFRGTPGCFDGVETCSELGLWDDCVGGVHAFPPDNCQLNNQSACHAITTQPYATVDLHTGTGTYSLNAVPGSESYAVGCPLGVSQCPSVTSPPSYTPLQSGQYSVTYTKMVAGDPNAQSCTFPLFVGAPGLRVELTWEHSTADMGVDLDLHLHQPTSMDPWATMPSAPQDCNWSSCTIANFMPPQQSTSPSWFPAANTMPMPCNWDLQQAPAINTCYNDPRGIGATWTTVGMGCHNPRLDVDNIQCDYSITDPTNYNFCAPENINIDYPPPNEWVRIATHYYYNHGLDYDVHPEIKVFCNGSLSADLGPHSYYVPETKVVFEPADGAGNGSGNRFWIAADVAFTTDSCGVATCVVQPIYADPKLKTPFLTLDSAATLTFAPPWPPPPQ